MIVKSICNLVKYIILNFMWNQSYIDYLNIQNTTTSSSSLNTSINEQQNQSNQINTQKENIYDKAVNFFSPSI